MIITFPSYLQTNMCRYQTLYHSDKTGYIIRCEECEKIQVAYSNLVVTFERSDFDTFRALIQKIKNGRHPMSGSPVVRSIMIPSPCQGIQLLLSYNELIEFATMLDEADTELQSLDMIRLFDDNNFSNRNCRKNEASSEMSHNLLFPYCIKKRTYERSSDHLTLTKPATLNVSLTIFLFCAITGIRA